MTAADSYWERRADAYMSDGDDLGDFDTTDGGPAEFTDEIEFEEEEFD